MRKQLRKWCWTVLFYMDVRVAPPPLSPAVGNIRLLVSPNIAGIVACGIMTYLHYSLYITQCPFSRAHAEWDHI